MMAVAITSSSTTPHVLHHLLRPPPSQQFAPPQLLSYFLRPTCTTTTTTTKTILSKSHKTPSQKTNTILFSSLSSLPSSPLLFSLRSFPCFQRAHNHSLTLQELEEEDQREEEKGEGFIDDEIENGNKEDDIEGESDNLELEDSVVDVSGDGSTKEGLKRNGVKVPTLTVKEKKELASYAHGLGKKLKSQLIGKSGFTDNVATSFIETLEANELLKIKIHRTCPGELEDVVRRLEEATGSVVVGQIGRTVIIYRPSLTKMKAEEKRQQARRVYVRKTPKLMSVPLSRGEPRRFSGHGRRGSSRV
ncbi:PREDICTED: uncharacterized protein LOC105141875 [Populus euphratica]|uniref:Uncharacterized protein LOC105141875 n=1 Tax=Populus euphratica TaxID=75702 RepID=A0AAJ6Y9K9_POPEU|nr:PREDICTED: uncharacterized protein LOC105141875 [Populus euphratica]